MNYWQVGSGQEGRRTYSDECLRFGMAFAGARYWKNRMEKVRKDDLVVLRYGTRKIVAVGKVIEHNGAVKGLATEEEKRWLKDFDGWDLPAYCYVEWHESHRLENARKQLPQSGFSQLKDEEYCEQAQQVFNDNQSIYPSNRDGPRDTRRVEDHEARAFLKQHLGERSEEAFLEIRNIRELARKYYGDDDGFRYWNEFKEHEIRTFLIVPLLLTLGWRREQIKIEVNPKKLGARKGGSIDVACFSNDYLPGEWAENGENCKLIIESKTFGSGLAPEAVEQARDYADSLLDRRSKCDLIFVSSGYCYKAYARNQEQGFASKPSAYLNLLKPSHRYPLDPLGVDGALRVLELLLP